MRCYSSPNIDNMHIQQFQKVVPLILFNYLQYLSFKFLWHHRRLTDLVWIDDLSVQWASDWHISCVYVNSKETFGVLVRASSCQSENMVPRLLCWNHLQAKTHTASQSFAHLSFKSSHFLHDIVLITVLTWDYSCQHHPWAGQSKGRKIKRGGGQNVIVTQCKSQPREKSDYN